MKKICPQCNKEFTRNKQYSDTQWKRAKFCSQKCQWLGSDRTKQGGHNKGVKRPLKREEDRVSPLQEQIRKSFEYRQWRSDIFTRDDFTCQICRIRGGKMCVDHYPTSFRTIFYDENIKTLLEAENCSRLWNINNGRTLCVDCHRKTDNYGHLAKKT